jgi:energy-coupling factor transporter ATP-binding protein EcfA2
MRSRRPRTLIAPPPDPFGERNSGALRERLHLLGARFDFETDSARLLRIVHTAYARLPPHRLPGVTPHMRVKLVLTPPERRRIARRGDGEPPPVKALAAGGILCGAMDRAGFVTLAPQQRAALIVVPQDLLRYAYHLRYELLEFAVYVLAARVQRLVPLHAACVGRGGRGVLLVGQSGAGKSTFVLHCLLDGLEFLAEDSVLVRPQGLLATGVANFLHLRPDALRFLDRAAQAAVLRHSAVIRRRSGVRKLEIDLRHAEIRLAATPQRIRAVLFLSKRRAGTGPLLVRLNRSTVLGRLAASQRYAAQQPGWNSFRSRVSALPAYELRRGTHPREAVEALRELLGAK